MGSDARGEFLSARCSVAVENALAFWKRRVVEGDAATDEIAHDAGWGDSIDKRDGGTWDWCGMFVGACMVRAGLCKALRRGFFHTRNVERMLTYRWEDRVPRWVWDEPTQAWCDVRAWHEAEGSLRCWRGHDALDLRTLDIRPGDIVLIDHQGDGRADHITLAERFDADTGVLVTLEGNGRGTVVRRVLDDGSVEESTAKRDSVVRNQRDLRLPAQWKKLYGVGRLSALDFEQRRYDGSERPPTKRSNG